MAKKVISINYDIPGNSDNCHDSESDQSLLDADIILFQPETFYASSGKPSYNEQGSFELSERTKHWRAEIATALKYGKTVFLLLEKFQVAKVYTGRVELKGTKSVHYTTDANNYEFLPVNLPISSKGGSEIVYKGHPVFATFWKEFKPRLHYEAYVDGAIDTPVFVTKTGERPVGGVIRVGGGHLVLLPMIEYDIDEFTATNKKTDESEWTGPAMEFGSRLVRALVDIDSALRSESSQTPPPGWVGEPAFVSTTELQVLAEIERLNAETDRLAAQISTAVANLEADRAFKDLLFETGQRLEDAVTSALRILGFAAENFADGTLEFDQVITSPEGGRFIGECEGKDNSAVNIDKFRQLEENIHSDLQREEVTEPAVGILFGNGYRLTAPKDRQEQFTAKCLKSAERGSILVRTMDLYPVIRYLQTTNDEAYKKSCRDAIVSAIGGIATFPPLPTPA